MITTVYLRQNKRCDWMRKLSPCAIFQAFCLPDLNLSDRVASADSVQAENWFWCEVGVLPKTSSSCPILEEKGPPYYTLSKGEEKEDRACLSFEMKTHLWSAEIGPDWNWGGGDARMIPPQASRVWNRWPWHSWEGRWGFHSKERDSGGTGGDLEQQGINCKERGLRLKLTKNDFLAGELWLHQGGVRHQVRG